MSKQIFVIDDEQTITSALSVLLAEPGYEVVVFHSGTDALEQLSRTLPHLIVLDVMMPGLDGYEVCRRVRQQMGYVPILMLTAKDETWEKVTGLELGADVYMTKPFEPRELRAQVKALLRLAEQTHSLGESDSPGYDRPLSCGPLCLYPERHCALLDEREIELSPKEFELLHFLMRHPGQVFGRQTLLRRVWGDVAEVGSRTVDTHVQRLRSKIEADPTRPELLQTVRGFGYRLVPPEMA